MGGMAGQSSHYIVESGGQKQIAERTASVLNVLIILYLETNPDLTRFH